MPITTEPKGPKPPLPGLVKVQLFWSSHVVPATFKGASIFHIRWSDSVNHPAADLTALATLLTTAPTGFNRLLQHLSSDIATAGIAVNSLGGDGLNFTQSFVVQGSGAAGTLPPQCAVCVSWVASYSWRGGHARTYLPGIPSSARASVAGAGLLSSFSTSVANDAGAMIADLSTATIGGAHPQLGLASYYSRGALRTTPLFFPYLSAAVHDRIDSQRRRSGKESSFPID